MTDKSREAARNVKQKARETKDTVVQKGTEAAHKLQEQGKAYAADRQNQLGERIHGYSSAVRRAAEKLRDEQDPNIAHYAEMVAERLDQAADYVQARDVGTIMRDVETLVRRRPEIFFGGMFVAGLALSRFFKASSERYEYDADDEEYWVDDGSEYQEDAPINPSGMDTTPPDLSVSPAPPSAMQESNPAWAQKPNPVNNL